MNNGLYATINVGASAFRMQVSEFTDSGERVLETLVKPLRLGRDTFGAGYITLENVYRSADILAGFKAKLDEYGITDNYLAVATSGVREARNNLFFLDHINTRTGIRLSIINPTDEIYIKYLGIRNEISSLAAYEKKGVLLANISSGNVAVALIKKGVFVYAAALPYGSLRLRQIFRSIPIHQRYKAYEQYAAKMSHAIRAGMPSRMKISHFVGAGSSVTLLSKLLGNNRDLIDRKDIEKLYEAIRDKSGEEIMRELSLRSDEADVIVPTLATYRMLCDFSRTETVHFSRATFPQVLTLYSAKRLTDPGLSARIRKTLFAVGERYNLDRAHAKAVTRYAVTLFDELADIHSLPAEEKLLLEAACILHDIGYYIDFAHHHEHSYYISKSLEVPGLDTDRLAVVSLLILMHRGGDAHLHVESLPIGRQLLVRKLVSILRIADVLDASHTQPVVRLSVDIRPDNIVVTGHVKKPPFLEIEMFEQVREPFANTFGIPVSLETKLIYE